MNDLISREKAIETLKEYEAVEFDNFTKTGPVSMMTVSTITNCIEAIAKLPSAETERTAKVETYTDGQEVLWSICECETDVRKSYNYCPGCGAKLEWSENE